MNCNLCKSTNYKNYLKINGHKIVKCINCGLVYTLLSDKKVSNNLYSKAYFIDSGYKNYEENKEFIIASFNYILEKVINMISIQGNLLDIGCATGLLLEAAKRLGFEVYGLEISGYAAQEATKKGFKIFNLPIEQTNFNNTYNIVTMMGTIEHLANPIKAFKIIYNILKESGLIVISTPDIGSWLGSRKFQFKPLEHRYYYDKNTITMLLKKTGFKVINFEHEKIFRPVKFIPERLSHYFPSHSYIWNVMNYLIDMFSIQDKGLWIPTGQMVIFARKE